MQVLDRARADPEVAWLGSLVAGVLVLAAGALAFPKQVYWGFLWRYFWGPVRADAAGLDSVVGCPDLGTTSLASPTACTPGMANAVVAEPGYTLVSTLGYMVVLVFMLVGVFFLLQRLDLAPYREFLLALVPFMLFGGALRVVEDATDAAVSATPPAEPAVGYPLNALLISPVIYGTVFAITLGGLLVALWLRRSGATATYHYPLGGLGLAAFLATLGYLTWLAFTTDYVDFHPGVLVTVVVLATVVAVGAYAGVRRYAPEVVAGTGLVGLVVVWAHAVDGVANVVASDWTHVFGIDVTYGSKHVFNRFVVDVTNALQPASVTATIGDSWPFLVVKVVVATAILLLFDEEFVEESPRYTIMLLGAIIAVGLGPGTRDVLRVTFGI